MTPFRAHKSPMIGPPPPVRVKNVIPLVKSCLNKCKWEHQCKVETNDVTITECEVNITNFVVKQEHSSYPMRILIIT